MSRPLSYFILLTRLPTARYSLFLTTITTHHSLLDEAKRKATKEELTLKTTAGGTGFAGVKQARGGRFMGRVGVGNSRSSIGSSFTCAEGAALAIARRTKASAALATTHYSLLTTRYTTHYSLLTTRYSLLTTHHSLHYSLLATHYSLLTTHYSLLTTHYSLLTTHYSLLWRPPTLSSSLLRRRGSWLRRKGLP